MKKNVFVIIGSVFLSLLIFYLIFFKGNFIAKNVKPPPPDSITAPDTTSDGIKIIEKDLGYTLTIPKNYIGETNGDFSRTYRPDVQNTGQGPINFLYISVVPKGKEGEEGTIYNYSQNNIQTLRNMAIGETRSFGGNTDPNLNQYFSYQRDADLMLGGYGAKSFVNTKPWEFPNGTTEYRYLVEFEAVIFIIGGYTGEDIDLQGTITKSEMDSIFADLKITPETITSYSPPPTINEWKTYTNKEAGLTFEYPGNWQFRTDGQNFPDKDIFGLFVVGQTQRPQTELYDGVNFAVMKPQATDLDTLSWMKTRYETNQPEYPDRPPKYESVSFSGLRYEKITICGLGCFPYYHIKINGKIYGYLGFAVGPNENYYNSMIGQIISSIKYY